MLVTVQVKVSMSVRLGVPSSATVMVTGYVPAAVNGREPLMSPLPGSIPSPAGSPSAVYKRVSPGSGSVAPAEREIVSPSASDRSGRS